MAGTGAIDRFGAGLSEWSFGLVTRRQLHELGYDDVSIARARRRGEWVVRTALASMRPVRCQRSGRPGCRVQAAAGVLALRTGALVSHEVAALMHGLPLLAPPREAAVTLPRPVRSAGRHRWASRARGRLAGWPWHRLRGAAGYDCGADGGGSRPLAGFPTGSRHCGRRAAGPVDDPERAGWSTARLPRLARPANGAAGGRLRGRAGRVSARVGLPGRVRPARPAAADAAGLDPRR